MTYSFYEFQWRIMKRLQSGDYYSSYEKLVKMFEGKEFEDLYIMDAIVKARAQSEALNEVLKISPFHKNTEEIVRLSSQCRTSLQGLFLGIDGGVKSVSAEKQEAGAELVLWARKLRRWAVSRNREKQSSAIDKLYKTMQETPAVSAALEKLNLAEELAGIKSMHDQAVELEVERTLDVANVVNRGNLVRTESYWVLDSLLGAIAGRANMGGADSEMCQSIFKQVERHLSLIRARVAARDTRNANAAEKAKDQNSDSTKPDADHDPETGSGEGIDQVDSGDYEIVDTDSDDETGAIDTPEMGDSDDQE